MKLIKVIIFITFILSFFAGCDQKSKSLQFVSEEQIESAVIQSDNYSKYRSIFVSATRGLIEEGTCSISDLRDMGGWVKSQNHKYVPDVWGQMKN